MGTLFYGSAEHPIEIEDVELAHLKVVIATKLRRNESFTLTWRHDGDQPLGRSTIWLHPSIPLRFEFDDPNPPDLSAERVHGLADSATTSGGIIVPDKYIID